MPDEAIVVVVGDVEQLLMPPNQIDAGKTKQDRADEVAIVKGNPARVEDVEKGSTQGGRLTVYMRDGRVIADDVRGSQAPGRIKSTHKVKKQ